MQSQTKTSFALLVNALFVLVLSAASPAVGQEAEPTAELTVDVLAELAVEMQREVEALRGWKFKHPVEVGLYTEQQVRAFLQGEGADEPDGEGERDHDDASMEMIGLIPPGCDSMKAFEETMMSFVPGGIYDQKTKAVQVVKKLGVHSGSIELRTTLAHELTHALDDQYFDFDKPEKVGGATSDADFVMGAVFEGSAVIVQERYELRAKRSGKFDSTEFDKTYKEAMKQMGALAKAPPHVVVWVARFPNGVRFLFRGDLAAFMGLLTGSNDPGSVTDALRTAATNLPRSSEQILHPEKYWQAEQRDEPVIISDKDVEELLESEGFDVLHRDTVGELLCAVLTSPADKKLNPMAMPMPGYWTNAAATGWGGDRFFLVTVSPGAGSAKSQPENLCGVWFTMWDTPSDREEFIDAYETHRALPARAILRLGKLGAVFVFARDETRRQALEKRLRTASLELTCEGKPWSFEGSKRPADTR